MASTKIILSREQLQEFLKDQRAIRAFEQLFQLSTETTPDDIAALQRSVQEASIEAGSATVKANVASNLAKDILDDLGVVSTSPRGESIIIRGTTSQYWRGDKTWQDFAASVRSAVLTGLSTATNAVITASDTVLSAFGKLQKQFSDHFAGTAEHGATGAVVGTTNSQTLTNKTLTAPIISTISNTGTLTLPTSTDTLVGKATTDTFTNKTYDTAGTGNVFKINGTTISATTGSGSAVLATSPTLVTPNIGAATGTSINLSGSGTFSQTAGIIGTTTNNNADAGSVGEFPTPTNVAGATLTTSTATNLSSVSLTAGDYEVSGICRFLNAATTTGTTVAAGISTTSATFGAIGTYSQITAALPVSADNILVTPVIRISIASTTTVYLIGYATFITSTCTASGFLHIRRVR